MKHKDLNKYILEHLHSNLYLRKFLYYNLIIQEVFIFKDRLKCSLGKMQHLDFAFTAVCSGALDKY